MISEWLDCSRKHQPDPKLGLDIITRRGFFFGRGAISVAVKERPIIGVWKRPIVTIAPSKRAERTTLLDTKLHHRTIRERSGTLARVVIVRISQLAVTADFFEGQIKQCNSLAARAFDKSDREFWLRSAHRWEALLEAKQRGTLNVEVPAARFERPSGKRRRAA
jgi:hypothetical protein